MDKLKMHSPDLTSENIAKIRALFPSSVTEAKDQNGRIHLAVDFDQLRQELSNSIVEGPQQRYHLNWPGKREALLAANAPIARTFRPAREDSVNFDTTSNLFIEGDNLEALKLLLETYLGIASLIYLDPPYNTGRDFLYEDDFSITSEEYLQNSLQQDDLSNRLIANPELSGRFHSDWLSHIYPRLILAKKLLKDDGVLAISIDDNEIANLLLLVDELFGWENRKVVCVKMSEASGLKMGGAKKHGTIPKLKEYLVLCSKNGIRGMSIDGIPKEKWDTEYNIYLDGISREEREMFNAALSGDNSYSLKQLDTIAGRISLQSVADVFNKTGLPQDKKEAWCFDNAWRICQCATSASVLKLAAEKKHENKNQVFFVRANSGATYLVRSAFSETSTKPRVQLIFADDNATVNPGDLWTDIKTTGLDGEGDVSFKNGKKPLKLLTRILKLKTSYNDVVMDLYSGSGSFAHATLALNAADGANRRFIAIQLPEVIPDSDAEQTAAKQFCISNGLPPNVAELSKERIRRAGEKLTQGENHSNWNKDIGFRVLKIDTSNMADVYYAPDATNQGDLLKAIDNIKPERNDPEDLLFQVLVDWGVDLTLPIRKDKMNGKTVFFVNTEPYDLVACFDKGVTEDIVKELAKHKPMRVVFRDNGFASDAIKINADQIFRQLSPSTEVKSI